jgi:hypothetical protein
MFPPGSIVLLAGWIAQELPFGTFLDRAALDGQECLGTLFAVEVDVE